MMPALTFSMREEPKPELKASQIFGGDDVGNALVASFTLDGKITLVAQSGQSFEKAIPVDLAGPSGDFFTPSACFLGAIGILDMALLEVGPEPSMLQWDPPYHKESCSQDQS